MGKTRSVDRNGERKGTWTPEEDWKLIAYVTRYGHWNWRLLPKFAGLARSGKSCRLRWLNYLSPNIKIGNYTREEDETIVKLVQHLGSRWSIIASQLPGRTDNGIKNHWHTNLKKRFQQNSGNTRGKVEVSKSSNRSLIELQLVLPSASDQSSDSCSSTTLISPSSKYFATSNDHTAPANSTNFLDALIEEPMSENLLLDDSLPVDPMPNNTTDPCQIHLPPSQSTNLFPASTTSTFSGESSITINHHMITGNLTLEDEFEFLNAHDLEPIYGNFLLDEDSPAVNRIPMPNNNITDPFQVIPITTSQFTDTGLLSNKNLVPENVYPFMETYEEPMIESFMLDHTLVEPMPNNILIGACPSQASSELPIFTYDQYHTTATSNENLVPELDEFAPLDTLIEEHAVRGSFWLEQFVDDIDNIGGEILITEPECSVWDEVLWSLDSVLCP